MQRVIKEVVEAIGLAGAYELVRKWGGREFYVAVRVGPEDPLALVLGLETAKRLVEAYGGQCLRLPAERHAMRSMRNAAIMRAIASKADGGEGLSHERAGLKFGLTRQQISHIAKQARESQEFAGTSEKAEA